MFQAPRGTRDVLPADEAVRRLIVATAQGLAELAGYGGIEPPTFEQAELFIRSVGAGTDIVEKEMYVFEDRGGARLALRPEGTASVCRAYLQHGLANEPQPVKLFYHLPIFRYERPQAGRFRQHTQFGLEAIGVRDPALDAEVMELAWRIPHALGLSDLTLLLNSIGDREDRSAYIPLLREHFAPHREQLCDDCRARFDRAPLRLLDCKNEACRPYREGAPLISEHLRPESAAYYEEVKGALDAVAIPFVERPTLVRGLDYYTHTVFEIEPPGDRSQGTLVAGGRYDGLIEELGGPATPGIGFGMGIERLVLQLRERGLTPAARTGPPVLVLVLGAEARRPALEIASKLRREGIGATLVFGERSLKAQLRHAGRSGARIAVILGERELAAGEAMVRDLSSGEQRAVPLARVLPELTERDLYTEQWAGSAEGIRRSEHRVGTTARDPDPLRQDRGGDGLPRGGPQP